MMNKETNKQSTSNEQNKKPNFARRRIAAVGLALLTLAGADAAYHGTVKTVHGIEQSFNQDQNGPAPLTAEQMVELPKKYVVQPGDTVWSIASAEGKAVANKPEALFEAKNQIAAQLPTKEDRINDILVPGEVIKLPANSEIGTLDSKSSVEVSTKK